MWVIQSPTIPVYTVSKDIRTEFVKLGLSLSCIGVSYWAKRDPSIAYPFHPLDLGTVEISTAELTHLDPDFVRLRYLGHRSGTHSSSWRQWIYFLATDSFGWDPKYTTSSMQTPVAEGEEALAFKILEAAV